MSDAGKFSGGWLALAAIAGAGGWRRGRLGGARTRGTAAARPLSRP